MLQLHFLPFGIKGQGPGGEPRASAFQAVARATPTAAISEVTRPGTLGHCRSGVARRKVPWFWYTPRVHLKACPFACVGFALSWSKGLALSLSD